MPPLSRFSPQAMLALTALTLALAVAPTPAHAVPTIDRPVVDPNGLLDASSIEGVAAQLVALRDKTGVQMAVLVVKTTDGVPIEDYAHATFEAWGGGSKQRNDGVLFVL